MEQSLRSDDYRLDRDAVPALMNEIDLCAVEEALRVVEAHGGAITVVTVGPDRAAEALRMALSMGAHAALHLVGAEFVGSDALSTSYALAEVLRRGNFDLVFFGSRSTDAGMGAIPSMVAERLGVAQLTLAQRVDVVGSTITVQRETESGSETLEAQIPAVVSVVEGINEPRYPSFKGIVAAKGRHIETMDAASAGLDVARLGHSAAASKVIEFAKRPTRGVGVRVDDNGEGGIKIADFLAHRGLI
jgi:electron transfer flavoprotein beta subunit